MFTADDHIDKADPLPRHAQVRRTLREMVSSGRLRPGEKIPAELDIADALGVSKMTVNKALLALTANGVFVREVGRGTFVSGRPASIASSRTKTFPAMEKVFRIAISFPPMGRSLSGDIDYSMVWSIYRGAADYFQALGENSVEIILASPPAADVLQPADQTDGWIVIAPRARAFPAIERLWRAGTPVVVAGASWPAMGVPSVDTDHIGAATEATRHLIQLGHERIALLFAEGETTVTQDRIVGFRRALASAHLTHDTAWEVWAEDSSHAGNWAKERLSDLTTSKLHPVTAIFAASYSLTLEAMNAVRAAGLRVPDDVSITGIDDPPSARLIYPPLTAVRQPLYEMGRRAADRVLRIIKGTEERLPSIREILPASLIVRCSSAPVGRPAALDRANSALEQRHLSVTPV